MIPPIVFREIARRPWWRSLRRLDAALAGREPGAVLEAYCRLVATLVEEEHASLCDAAADALLAGAPRQAVAVEPPAGLRDAALFDLAELVRLVRRDWRGEAQQACGRTLPPLDGLASADGETGEWASRLLEASPEGLLARLQERAQRVGAGTLSRHLAFAWRDGRLHAVTNPSRDSLAELVGLDHQICRIEANVERFLAGKPAQHMLLYGARGSGKSTAVRALLERYHRRGLRLVELPPASLTDLPLLAEAVSGSPLRFLAFVDDLAFEPGDERYRPLRTLLEGNVSEPPANLLVAATSNRRHLVRQGFRDRPMPEDDDASAWDTQHELLALADRFGLVVTFPNPDRHRYLSIVRELAARRGVAQHDLEERAVRHADWGNGYSGRTARQFVESLESSPADG